MAHYCEMDKDNTILRVIVVANSDCIKDSVKMAYPSLISTVASVSGKSSIEGETIVEWEDESKGIMFCENLLGGRWVQTSYHGNIRKQYAGIGYTYDCENDVFIAPKPYPSWTLDKAGDWQPPTPYPDDGKLYSWDEKAGEWVKLTDDILSIA